ncbi:MAG: radical SAM protein [Clostridiaceae bacterium]|nr:radical SAM protein [Clostridiaceae bacterium]
MKKSGKACYNAAFSHIYVERQVWGHPRTERILKRFPHAVVVQVEHYKDVFCRKKQDYQAQHQAQSLILAAKKGQLVYPGASVCQSFGNEHFYYTSCVMNCIYDCEYCYLKGMYPSGNLVAFVNLEDIFAETEALLQQHSVYMCVSYDTDLLALESVLGFVQEWEEFVAKKKNLRVEIRTKCGRIDLWEKRKPSPALIYAFTMSPQFVVEHYEHRTAALAQRIRSAAEALDRGFCVRLCFDPMIYGPDWREQYHAMLCRIFDALDIGKIVDVSIGSFRISQEYLKRMRKNAPDSAVVQFPYENRDGVYQYPDRIRKEMELFLLEQLTAKIPREKLFFWKDT